MLAESAGALCSAGRAPGMRGTDARFFTERCAAGRTTGLGATAFLTLAFAFAALRAGFFALAAFFLAPLPPAFLPFALAMPAHSNLMSRVFIKSAKKILSSPICLPNSVGD